MSCEKRGEIPVAVVDKSIVPTVTEKGSVRYIDPIDIYFGGGKPYQAAIERRAAEIIANPRFSI